VLELLGALAFAVALCPLGCASEGGTSTGSHGLPNSAVPLVREGFFITNSMVVTWVVAALIILFARLATRRLELVPSGAQNLWEWTVECLHDFLESIVGAQLVKKTFWFFATVFLFILACNWFGLIPGIGTIGWGSRSEHGFEVGRPLLRGANADLNMTFAMAVVFFACWIVWAVQVNGFKGFVLHLFGPKGEASGAIKYVMILVFVAVGLLETVSILFRPVSLSFRLYGNIFAGENLLEAMARVSPALGWLMPIPFYFFEILVGLVQALVFTLLTSVFTLVICLHEEGHEQGHQ
jgi:F-type H+-transporting ATPase subunit a